MVDVESALQSDVAFYVFWFVFHGVAACVVFASLLPFPCGRMSPHSCWRRWINFEDDPANDRTYLRFYFSVMSPFQRAYDLVQYWHLFSLMFCFGNVATRFTNASDIVYACACLVFVPVFGFLGRIRGLDLWISPSGIRNLTPLGKAALVALAVLLVALFAFHGYLAYVDDILVLYMLAPLAIIAVYFSLYRFYLERTKDPGWHIHHWFTGFFCALMFRFDHPVSKAAFAIFYAVFIQGAIAFGVTPIITGPGGDQPPAPARSEDNYARTLLGDESSASV